MTNRVLDFSEAPSRLSAAGGLLRIQSGEESERTVPFSHIAAIVCSHGQVSFTQAVLAELAAVNAILVACDAKHLPVAMMLPLVVHGEQTNRFQWQASASMPLRKRLWREIVVAKIRAQGATLLRVRGQDFGLPLAAGRVKISNADSLEAQASRVYWQLLFDDKRYFRSAAQDDRNALLNYGYAIIRAVVARALCCAGLHPALALHHHNKYDPYPLANDLMEPFRPLADEWAAKWCDAKPAPWPLDRLSKASLLSRIAGRFTDDAESRTMFDWAELWSERLARCLEKKREGLTIEEIRHVDDQGAVPGPQEDSE